MMGKWFKKAMALGLIGAMAVTGFAGCGSKQSAGGADDFTWWIYKIDGDGTYYQNYEDTAAAQYVMAQYWDSENGGIGTKDTGKQLNFSYLVPVAGSEQDNFNTMMGTGEYPEIVDTTVSSDSPIALNEAGVAMDITEYVEKYMPNYTAYLDEHPSTKSRVTFTDDNGELHYYAIYSLINGSPEPWVGPIYRRDWIVKYATPSEYVWDRDSAYVQENGHPEVTPLAAAKKANNLNGWKKNEVTAFTADYGKNPDDEYTDNVIFPSGTSDPLTISDWEWMFAAFDQAREERGWKEDSSSYDATVYYTGSLSTGDLVSSFGGGNGNLYMKDGEVVSDTDSDNFKTYVDCMSTWYENGWLDKEFNTRSSDAFFMINTSGVNQGKVGLWSGLVSTLGTAIRTSCSNEEDAKDAYAMAAPLPINDEYGSDAQKYVEPDTMYQDPTIGGGVIITDKAKDKDLATLFTYFDWAYTQEGSLTLRIGPNEEQQKSVKMDPDFYADYGIDSAYSVSKDDTGRTVYTKTIDNSDIRQGSLVGSRMDIGFNLVTNDEEVILGGATNVVTEAFELWNKYENTGSTMNLDKLLTASENTEYGDINTAMTDYVGQNLPAVIKGTKSWDEYVKGIQAIDTKKAAQLLNNHLIK